MIYLNETQKQHEGQGLLIDSDWRFYVLVFTAALIIWEVNAGPLHGKTYLSLLALMILSASPGSHLLSLFF